MKKAKQSENRTHGTILKINHFLMKRTNAEFWDLAWTLRSVAFVQEEMLRIKRAFLKISVFVNYVEQMPDVPRSNKKLDRIHATTEKEPYLTECSLGQGFG